MSEIGGVPTTPATVDAIADAACADAPAWEESVARVVDDLKRAMVAFYRARFEALGDLAFGVMNARCRVCGARILLVATRGAGGDVPLTLDGEVHACRRRTSAT